MGTRLTPSRSDQPAPRADLPVPPAGRRIVFLAANPSIDRFLEVESLSVGTIHRPDLTLAVPGGKGLNAVRAAAALGGRVTAVGIVGGKAGDWIAEQLAALRVEASLVQAPDHAETRTCMSVLDRTTGRLTEFYEPGLPIEPSTWEAFEEAVAQELEPGDVGAVVCSGSLPPGAPRDGYARICASHTRVAGRGSSPSWTRTGCHSSSLWRSTHRSSRSTVPRPPMRRAGRSAAPREPFGRPGISSTVAPTGDRDPRSGRIRRLRADGRVAARLRRGPRRLLSRQWRCLRGRARLGRRCRLDSSGGRASRNGRRHGQRAHPGRRHPRSGRDQTIRLACLQRVVP